MLVAIALLLLHCYYRDALRVSINRGHPETEETGPGKGLRKTGRGKLPCGDKSAGDGQSTLL